MSDVFVIATAQQALDPGIEPALAARRSGEAAAAALLQRAGLQARHVQEAHWLAGPHLDAPAWPSGAPVLRWPPGELLDHFVLHAVARTLRLGERELVLVGQLSQPENPDGPSTGACTALLLGAPAALGRHNLTARARLALFLSASGPPEPSLDTTANLLNARAEAAQAAYRQNAEALARALVSGSADLAGLAAEGEIDLLPAPGEIHWLAANVPFAEAAVQARFPQAQIIRAAPTLPGGALFLLADLLQNLAGSRRQWGLLLSAAPHAGLATLVERV